MFSLGIVGLGAFGCQFQPIFLAHPAIKELRGADIIASRLSEFKHKKNDIKLYDTFDSLLQSDVDAVAIFTQRHLHAQMAIKALEEGKHVYSAVPAATSLQELEKLIEAVNNSGKIYMLGETSYYYPSTIYCRKRFKAGDFGHIVYGEGAYYHDMQNGFYEAFQHSGGENWKQVAGFPPMMYPTHSFSMILSVTGARCTQISCLGFEDKHDDLIFRKGHNLWDNIYSNQTAFGRTSDGGMVRINEFRRIGYREQNHGGVIGSILGTEGTFTQHPNSAMWSNIKGTDMSDLVLNQLIKCAGTNIDNWLNLKKEGFQKEFISEKALIHPVEKLPKQFETVHDGHMGSHQFLVHDFCTAVEYSKLPPNNVWDAARYNAPGLVALESAEKNGKMLSVPDFGSPPKDAKFIECVDNETLDDVLHRTKLNIEN